MKDSKRYFHPETIKRISRLELRAKYIVEGLLSGMHRSAFFGQSIEFRQHRDYVQGDDLRHVDWKLWARQDRLYVKQFEEETDLRCHILVDGSKSMSYASGTFSKFEYAATLACCLGYLIIRQKDQVGCSLFDEEILDQVPCKGKASQLEAISSLFTAGVTDKSTSLQSILKDYSRQLNKKSLVVLISDFFDDVEQLVSGLQMLRMQGHDLLLIQVLDSDEINFPFDGPTHFEGLEVPAELKCNPAAFRESYKEALNEFRHELTKGCAVASADFECCTTDMAFNTVISSLLNRRASKQRS